MINSIYINHNTKGLNNAYLHHLKNQEKRQDNQENRNLPQVQQESKSDSNLAETLELTQNSSTSPNTYSIKSNSESTNINVSRVRNKLSDDAIFTVRENKVDINGQVDVDNGSDMLIIDKGSKVNINSQVGVDNSNDTLIIGKGAKVDINGQAAVDSSNDIIVIGDGAHITINGSVKIDNLNNAIVTNNNLSIYLKDEQNHSYRWDIGVKDKKEAESIIETLKNKSDKRLSFDELKSAVEEQKTVIKAKKKNQDTTGSLGQINYKQLSQRQLNLELKSSLVKLLANNSSSKEDDSISNRVKSSTTKLYESQKLKLYNMENRKIINKFA